MAPPRGDRWVDMFRLDQRTSGARTFLAGLFWLWGLGGMLIIGAEFAVLFTGSVGIGTSGYVTAHCVFWLGGLVFFGIGALLTQSDFIAVKKVSDE